MPIHHSTDAKCPACHNPLLLVSDSTIPPAPPSPGAANLADRLLRWWQLWASEQTWGGNQELKEIAAELRTLSAPRPAPQEPRP